MGEQLTAGEWLGRFGEALASGEVDRVVGLFGDESLLARPHQHDVEHPHVRGA